MRARLACGHVQILQSCRSTHHMIHTDQTRRVVLGDCGAADTREVERKSPTGQKK